MATAVLTQLLLPHLGQIRCNKEAAVRIVSSKTPSSASDSLSPAGSGSMKATAEMVKACAVLLSVPGVPKLFHVPPKNSVGFWPASPVAKQTMLRYTERNFYVQNSFLSFSFFLTFIWFI